MSDVRVQIIRSSRLKLGEAPRTFDKKLRRYLYIKRPFLAFGMPKQLKSIYDDHQFLLEQGNVVWAVLVVASNDLFSKGQNDGRGVVVYSPQLHLHDELLRLVELADKMGEQRTRYISDVDEKRLYGEVNNNNGWLIPQAVPASLSKNDSVFTSSILCVRKHMPQNRLVSNCFPILTHPKITSIAMLPELFWPEDLRANWTSND